MEISPSLLLTTLVNSKLALLPGKRAFKKLFRSCAHEAAFTSLIDTQACPKFKQQHRQISRSLNFNGSAYPCQTSPPTVLISNRSKLVPATAFLNSVLCQQTVKINCRSCLQNIIVSVSKPRSKTVFEWIKGMFWKTSLSKMSRLGKTPHLWCKLWSNNMWSTGDYFPKGHFEERTFFDTPSCGSMFDVPHWSSRDFKH